MTEWQRWVLLPVTVPMLLVYAAMWLGGYVLVNTFEKLMGESHGR